MGQTPGAIIELLVAAGPAARLGVPLQLQYFDPMFRADAVTVEPFLHRVARYEQGLTTGCVIARVRAIKEKTP